MSSIIVREKYVEREKEEEQELMIFMITRRSLEKGKYDKLREKFFGFACIVRKRNGEKKKWDYANIWKIRNK